MQVCSRAPPCCCQSQPSLMESHLFNTLRSSDPLSSSSISTPSSRKSKKRSSLAMPQARYSEKGKEKASGLYQTLDTSKQEFRLLKILPDPSWPANTEPIQCILCHDSLNEHTEYHALSYTWQDPSLGDEFNHPDINITLPIQDSILLNGENMSVTRNLWVALWHFRYIAQNQVEDPVAHNFPLGDWRRLVDSEELLVHSNRSLWIDALCINQLDDVERGHQVMIMAEIYKRAACVNVWLGLATEETFDAMVLLKGLQATIDPRKFAQVLARDGEIEDEDIFDDIYGDDSNEGKAPAEVGGNVLNSEIEGKETQSISKDLPIDTKDGEFGKEMTRVDPEGSTNSMPENSRLDAKAPINEKSETSTKKTDQERQLAHSNYLLDNKHLLNLDLQIPQVMEQFFESFEHPEMWNAFFSFCDREYWKRLWIIQEYLLGKRALIYIGQCVVDALLFSQIDFSVSNYCLGTPLSQSTVVTEYYRRTTEMQRGGFSSLKISMSKIPHSIPTHEPSSLLEYMRQVRNQLCSRPHDIIYGVLGLCDADTQANIPVDYSLELDQLFRHTTSYIIESSKSLEVLFENSTKGRCDCCKDLEQLPNLPSWVPDWRCRGALGSSLGVVQPSAQAAAAEKEAIISVSLSEGTLTCKGIFLGSIQHLQTPAELQTSRSMSTSVVRFVYKVLSGPELPHTGPNLVRVLEAVYMIAIALHQDYEPYISQDEFIILLMYCFDQETFADSVGERFAGREVMSTIQALGKCLSDTNLFTFAIPPAVAAEAPGILDTIEMGNCYPFCREGDVIALLYGCRKPIALRPDGDIRGRFKVVGQVYLPSFSSGEAVGKFEERDFVLS